MADRYQLLEPIGRGGMGIVWRAHDELLDRAVAVKEVRYPGDPEDDEVAELNRRTLREARAAGRLAHPNVVVVHDVIEENGRPWIVMQLVDARSLGQVLRDDGPMPVRMVAEIGLQILEALRSAHASGVLHRDVKPENVLLTDDGRVVLTDFGIARMETDTTMTRTGLVGTPAFIAPERLRGYPAQRESDFWSLGATLYAAVEGRPPHDKGMAMATMHAVLNDEPEPALRAGRLGAVLSGLLEKDPGKRLSPDQAERMLRSIAEDRSSVPTTAQRTLPATPLPTPPTSPPRKQPKPARRPEEAGRQPGAAPQAAEAQPRGRAEAMDKVQSLKQAPAARRPAGETPGQAPPVEEPSPAAAQEGAQAEAARPGAPEASPPVRQAEAQAAPHEAAQEEAGRREPAGERPAPETDPPAAGTSQADGHRTDARAAAREQADVSAGTGPDAPARPASRPIKAPVQPVRPVDPVERSAGPAAPAGRGEAQRPTHVPRQQAERGTEGRTRPETRKRPYGGAPGGGSYAANRGDDHDSPAASYEGPPPDSYDGGFRTSVAPPMIPMSPDGDDDGGPRRPLPLLRVALVAVPALILVAGIALWLGAREASDTPAGGTSASGGHSSAPATGPSGAGDSGAPSAAPSSPPASPSETAKPSPTPKPSSSSPAGVPDGWHKYKHSSGFSIALPKGWHVDGRGNGEVRFRGDSHSYLEVHHTSSPESDALKVWRRDVPGMSGNFPGYKLIAIREVKGYWKTAADWEFTFGDSRFRSRVIDRGFVTGKNNGYALLFKTEDKDWKAKKKLFETFAATFKPAK
ncbi:serine/threonine-protein kinase [Sphaerisporangium dianthi]|uniref:non-specific serine/threonine protein kinase n=1 Tax=Sphaerisporangium dianthi TaxID=1436120 RepID=A0ABV9CJ26_9ACTN